MAPSFELVVCITSTALFDCSTLERYKAHQCQRVKAPLKPGVGFPLVQSLLALNEVDGKHLVEVVLVSRLITTNFASHECRSRVARTSLITLPHGNMIFSSPPKRNKCVRFSRELIHPMGNAVTTTNTLPERSKGQVRIARAQGLEAFYRFEQKHGQTALPKEWALDIDETHFLGGLDKTPFLRAIDSDIYFDDSRENIDRAQLHVPSARVVYGINSTLTNDIVLVSPEALPIHNNDEISNNTQ